MKYLERWNRPAKAPQGALATNVIARGSSPRMQTNAMFTNNGPQLWNWKSEKNRYNAKMFIAFSSKLQVSKVLETFRFDHLDLFASPFLMISILRQFHFTHSFVLERKTKITYPDNMQSLTQLLSMIIILVFKLSRHKNLIV